MSVLALLAWIGVAGVALPILWVFYRVVIAPMFDPLRELPHPPASKLFGSVPDVMKEQTCAPQMRWVEKYGKTLSYTRMLSVSTVLTADTEFIKRVLVTHAKLYTKTPMQLRILRQALGEGLVSSVGEKHARARGLIKSHFQFQNLRSIFPVFVKQAHKLADFWDKQYADTGKELDVINSMSKFTLDVIGLSAFGYNFDATVNPDGPLTQAVKDMLPNLSVWMIVAALCPPLKDVLSCFHIGPYHKRKQAVAVVRGKVAEVIDARLRQLRSGDAKPVTEAHCLLDIMINDSYKDGTKMTPLELADQTMTFLMAGHETTSNALTWTWLLLSQHPHIERELREEVVRTPPLHPSTVCTVDGANRVLDWVDAESVRWESLRLYPPVPITNRFTTAEDVWMVNGRPQRIPKGTQVWLSPFVVHHHPDYWQDPEEFRPRRWFTDDAMTQKLRPKPFTFMPFLFGERSCIGQRFAVMEMQASLAILIRRFSLRRLPGAKDLRRKLMITMRPSPKLTMTVHRTESHHGEAPLS